MTESYQTIPKVISDDLKAQVAEMYAKLPEREMGRALSAIIHGGSKAGKSTLLNTALAPRLLIDAEMAYRFLPGVKIIWDPKTQAPPVHDGTWETCVVIVREYADMAKAYEWLNAGQHPFRSLNIDSISEVQSRCRDHLTASGQMNQQLWGDLLYEMDKLVRGFRDLTEHPKNPLETVFLSAMTQMKDGKYRPYVQGQLQVKLPYFLDVIGYLYVANVQDPNDPTKPAVSRRQMLVNPHDQFEAGERVQGKLPNPVVNPTIPEMLDMVFGPSTSMNKEN
jgi:hypothetical protein